MKGYRVKTGDGHGYYGLEDEYSKAKSLLSVCQKHDPKASIESYEYESQSEKIHRLEAENVTLKKQISLMAKYIVEFGNLDMNLCDEIPDKIHLKYQPKNDGNYENESCIQCVQEHFRQQAEQTHGEAEKPSCTNCQKLFGCRHREFEPNDYEPCAEYEPPEANHA
jgi:hypothetical protein